MGDAAQRGISIAPETTVELSFKDYAEGRDPVLETVLEQTSAD